MFAFSQIGNAPARKVCLTVKPVHHFLMGDGVWRDPEGHQKLAGGVKHRFPIEIEKSPGRGGKTTYFMRE